MVVCSERFVGTWTLVRRERRAIDIDMTVDKTEDVLSVNKIGGLGRFVSENQRDWDTVVSKMVSAYNTSKHESTGVTTLELFHGRPAGLPLDITCGGADCPADKQWRRIAGGRVPKCPPVKNAGRQNCRFAPRFKQSVSVSSRHIIIFANRCCEPLSYLVLTLAAQNGAGLSKVDQQLYIEGR